MFVAGCRASAATPKETPPTKVTVALPQQKPFTDFEVFTGRLVAAQTIAIRSRVTGYLQSAKFSEGKDVDEGAVLFVIEPKMNRFEVERSEALVKQAEARSRRALAQYERATKLLPSRGVSEQEMEVLKFDCDEAAAALATARSQCEMSKLNLEYTEVKATIRGRISRRFVDPGNMVKADETTLATLVSLDPIYAYFDIDERTAQRIWAMLEATQHDQPGKESIAVQLALEGQEDFGLKGVVTYVDNQLDPGTGTLRLRASIANSDGRLAAGMFVRCRIPIGTPHQALLIPEESLAFDQGQRYVLVVNGDSAIEQRRVTVGPLTAGLRVIETGLSASDQVVVSGLQRVRPGDKVSAIPAEAEKGGPDKSGKTDVPGAGASPKAK